VEFDDDSIVVGGTARETLLATMTLKQLKDMCSARGLSTHGKKSELADRLATC
jgi:hypothetical protein